MVKYFCDDCGKELSDSEVLSSLELTGKHLCREDCRKHCSVVEAVYIHENPKNTWKGILNQPYSLDS